MNSNDKMCRQTQPIKVDKFRDLKVFFMKRKELEDKNSPGGVGTNFQKPINFFVHVLYLNLII